MNRLAIETGGHPFLDDDLMHIQDGIKEALKGIASGFGGNFILSGCVVKEVGPAVTVTEGYIVLNGEVYYVEADAFTKFPLISPNLYWQVSETNSAVDPVVYEDGTSKSVHKVRRAIAAQDIGYPIVVAVADLKSVVNFALLNNWTQGGLPVPNPSYIKDGKYIVFQGDITLSDAAPGTNLPFATLPSGCRPLENGFYPAISGVNFTNKYLGTPVATWIRVETNGDCYADSNLAHGGAYISLSAVRFKRI